MKQRVVQLSVDETVGLPVVEPVSRVGGGGEGEEDGGRNQAIISLSFQDWQELKEALDISSPQIVHTADGLIKGIN